AMTRDAVLESDVREIAAGADQRAAAAEGRLAVGAVVDGASRLELVETFALGDGTGVRFAHAISQAYFLSRLLRDDPGAWRELVEGTPSAEMNRALVMWSARDGDRDRAAEVGDALVARAAALDADRALLLLVTAGEVASAVGRDEFGALAGDGAGGAWRGASVRARLAAIRRLERCAGAWSLRALRERTRDENYRVRWAAARAIAASGDAAWDVLGRDFERLVTEGAARRSASWTDRETHDISVAGWILPALAPALREPGRTAAGRLVERLAGLVPQVPAGTEASLAQGFKLDALTNPAGPVAPAAWELLTRARFWYSRIVLAHAACIRAIGDKGANPDAGRRLAELARRDPHPFAAAAADLCVRALRAGDRARWLWDDEVATITGSGGALDDGAARLLADVVLLLNLTEQGELAGSEAREAQEQRKEDAYRRPGLPHCLAGSRTRDELFDGCPPDRCPFDLCPYPATADRALGRGEFSAAFCRHQGEIAARRASAPARAARRGRPRWTRLSGRDAVRFWERMESRAS
ncbi:MAG TPA: hypothetical protein VLA98_13135, partial [Solirubrobacteraceae bacterium]|nr:hypothetical protein [Solirubrobacteraceae bacterium]